MQRPLGYRYLIDRFQLPARPLPIVARLDPAIKVRGDRRVGNQTIMVFERNYEPEDTLTGHLQFALRYEGANLEVWRCGPPKPDSASSTPSLSHGRQRAHSLIPDPRRVG